MVWNALTPLLCNMQHRWWKEEFITKFIHKFSLKIELDTSSMARFILMMTLCSGHLTLDTFLHTIWINSIKGPISCAGVSAVDSLDPFGAIWQWHWMDNGWGEDDVMMASQSLFWIVLYLFNKLHLHTMRTHSRTNSGLYLSSKSKCTQINIH